MSLHLLAVGDEAGHAVVGGVAEAGDNRGRLVAYAVDEGRRMLALGVARPHHVECNHHRHAHKGEGAHGEEEVDEEHPQSRPLHAVNDEKASMPTHSRRALAECGEAQAAPARGGWSSV